MNKRWICPRPSCASGVNAPARMRKDNVLRWCLPCSAATGKMVERICPSAEKEREEREAKAKEREKRKRARVRKRVDSREVYAEETARLIGLDLRAAAPVMWRAFKRTGLPMARATMPGPLRFVRSGYRSTGHAGYDGSVFMRVVKDRPGRTIEVLLHELAHHAAGFEYKGDNHGPVFNAMLAAGARELWPWITSWIGTSLPIRCRRGYALSRIIAAALEGEWALDKTRVLAPFSSAREGGAGQQVQDVGDGGGADEVAGQLLDDAPNADTSGRAPKVEGRLVAHNEHEAADLNA
jgi:hypothetical protein